MSTRVAVAIIPDCDICENAGQTVPAYADAKLGAGLPWANVCKKHFDAFGCSLGSARGQELVLTGGRR